MASPGDVASGGITGAAGGMALGGPVGAALGAVVGAAGSIIEGYAKSSAYQYQAGIARMNERYALQSADWSRAEGEVEAQKAGMGTRFRMGEEKITQAAGNLDVTRGSAAGVRQSEQEIGEFNEATLRGNAARKAYGFEVTAAGDEAQARLDQFSAGYAKEAGYMGAASSLLGGAASVSSKWIQTQQYFGQQMRPT